MRTTRSFFGLLLALLPILVIGGLLLLLTGVQRRAGGWLDGLFGPTMLGLAGIGLLFILLFALKFRRAATPPSSARALNADLKAAAQAEELKSDFDADAALARYLARRDAAPPPPGSFGRKQV
jgi:hypothetical protein